MNYVVFDLEWNQSSDDKEEMHKVIPFEIVEIGAVKLNSNKEKIGAFNQLIKPQVYKQIHYITKKIIHIQMEELNQAKKFREVMEEFLTWCGEDYIFCTWGLLDLIELQRNMRYYQMPLLEEGPMKFLDIQKLFSIAFEDSKSRKALEYAVDFLKIEKDIPFHRAYSDAYYTAKVFGKIKDETVERNVSFDVFVPPKNRAEEIKIIFDHYAKYISREFEDKKEALEDTEVLSTRCYLCHKNLKKKIKWFSTNGRHYLSVAYCDKHGYMKAKVRMKKSENQKVYVVKTLKFITQEEAEAIQQRRDKYHNGVQA
ncbi:MAG: 3'-5' exonuclease [Lachnospiraceae bacterium]